LDIRRRLLGLCLFRGSRRSLLDRVLRRHLLARLEALLKGGLLHRRSRLLQGLLPVGSGLPVLEGLSCLSLEAGCDRCARDLLRVYITGKNHYT